MSRVSKMDALKVRELSLVELERLGFPQPPIHLPVIDMPRVRSYTEVVDRALAHNVVINCAYRMPAGYARKWLERENLIHALTAGEEAFIVAIDAGQDPADNEILIQTEALWILVWALGLEPHLDFGRYCGDHLTNLLPNLREDESRDRFDKTTRLRPVEELRSAFDLAYCLTWGAADANLTGKPSPGTVRQYVLWERRRAFEWLSGEDWDDPPTDT